MNRKENGNGKEGKKAADIFQGSQDILDRSPAVVFLWKNKRGWPVEYVSENVRRLFGYSANEFRAGKISYSKTIHPDDAKRVAAEVKKYSAQEKRTVPLVE